MELSGSLKEEKKDWAEWGPTEAAAAILSTDTGWWGPRVTLQSRAIADQDLRHTSPSSGPGRELLTFSGLSYSLMGCWMYKLDATWR